MNLFKKIILIISILIIFNSYSYAAETLIIFDASISMNDDFHGQAKYMAAADEARKVISKYSPKQSIGLRTIGIKLDSSALNYITNPSLMCKATNLDVPISANSSKYIDSVLNSIMPLGTTPLEYTLRTSVNSDFSKGNSLKHIILITDGGENCDGDPCKYIRQLMQTRKDIKIDIIAISVNGEDFKQLKCLTDYTGGTIYNISEPKDLSSAFEKVIPDVSVQNSSEMKSNTQFYNNPANEIIKYKNYLFQTYD